MLNGPGSSSCPLVNRPFSNSSTRAPLDRTASGEGGGCPVVGQRVQARREVLALSLF